MGSFFSKSPPSPHSTWCSRLLYFHLKTFPAPVLASHRFNLIFLSLLPTRTFRSSGKIKLRKMSGTHWIGTVQRAVFAASNNWFAGNLWRQNAILSLKVLHSILLDYQFHGMSTLWLRHTYSNSFFTLCSASNIENWLESIVLFACGPFFSQTSIVTFFKLTWGIFKKKKF